MGSSQLVSAAKQSHTNISMWRNAQGRVFPLREGSVDTCQGAREGLEVKVTALLGHRATPLPYVSNHQESSNALQKKNMPKERQKYKTNPQTA
jgi:hypothetical protein